MEETICEERPEFTIVFVIDRTVSPSTGKILATATKFPKSLVMPWPTNEGVPGEFEPNTGSPGCPNLGYRYFLPLKLIMIFGAVGAGLKPALVAQTFRSASIPGRSEDLRYMDLIKR